ncbi:MAG TPA: pyroglutamyl-peptidase I [Pirellulaceae bacterium]|nr:pyroglutamyl-peptidase I [Pirellulaceae bacterium]
MSVPRVLITAFVPYDRWSENSSWQALVALTTELPESPKVVTRRYPVDFAAAQAKLQEDLSANYDYALLLGQSPGIGRVHLEAVGINIGGHSSQSPDEFRPLVEGGPAAYKSSLPLDQWAAAVRQAGIPCQVSYHAGTYLCNAVLYLAHFYAEQQRLKTRTTFIHLPLCPSQVLGQRQDLPSMTSHDAAQAVRIILAQLARPGWLF